MSRSGGDEALVRRALDAARALVSDDRGPTAERPAEPRAQVDVPVGAVVAGADGRVLSVAVNAREETGDPTAHAEVLALRAAAAVTGSWRLSGVTLAVTLEPCAMCAGAAVLARVDRVVFGAFDAKAGAVGSLWDVVRDRRSGHHPEVVAGVLAEECGALLKEFFASRRG